MDINKASNPLDLIMLKIMDLNQNLPQTGRFYYNDLDEQTRFKLYAINSLEEINLARTHLIFNYLNWSRWSTFLIGDLSIYPYLMAIRLHDQRYLRNNKFMIWPILYNAFFLWGTKNELIKESDYCKKGNLREYLRLKLSQHPTNQSVLPKTTIAPAFTPRIAEPMQWKSYLKGRLKNGIRI